MQKDSQSQPQLSPSDCNSWKLSIIKALMYHGNISGLLSPIWTQIPRHKDRQKHKWFRSIFGGCTITLLNTVQIHFISIIESLNCTALTIMQRHIPNVRWMNVQRKSVNSIIFRSIFFGGMICLLGLMTLSLLVWSLPIHMSSGVWSVSHCRGDTSLDQTCVLCRV